MPDWIPVMPAVLAALDKRRERRRFNKRHPVTYMLKDGTFTERPPLRYRLRHAAWMAWGRLNGLLCHSRRWRRMMCEWHRPVDCTCTFEETDAWPCSGHPGRDCPLRTDCGGWTWDPPCGGCDRCIEDQIAYYEAKNKGLIQ
jgi:hypothetical protein